jgi:hypothetical protein
MEVAELLGTTFEEVDMQWSPPQTQVEGLPTEGVKIPMPKADQKKKEQCSKCCSTTVTNCDVWTVFSFSLLLFIACTITVSHVTDDFYFRT